MADLLQSLRDEIRKQAKKELRASLDVLRRTVSQQRRDIAQFKRTLAQLERRIVFLEKQERERLSTAEKDVSATVRFSSKSVRSNRMKLGLSADEFGRLLGVSGQTIYLWERGKSRPRKDKLAELATIRTLGKRAARARLRLLDSDTES